MRYHVRSFGTSVLALLLWYASSALANHPIPEINFDEAGDDFEDATDVNRQIAIVGGGGSFIRDPLTDFDFDPALPVSSGGDKELLWDNGFVANGSLALTEDSDEGNYNFTDVRMQIVFAAQGDLPSAQPKAGVVVRHTGPEDVGPRKFYAAYGHVFLDGGELKIQFHLEKWFGTAFEDLQSGPAVSDLFDFDFAENFRVTLEVSGPDIDGFNQLTGTFERVGVVAGEAVYTPLVELAGTDRALTLGQVGLYAEAASVHTMIAFDEGSLAVLGTHHIPEPPTLVLAVIAAATLCGFRWRLPRRPRSSVG